MLEEQEKHSGLHVFVEGRVQGVWFRACTRSAALELGLVGWVRNRADGRVEIVAEGPRGALESLLAWCYEGSPMAVVDKVRHTWNKPTSTHRSFRIAPSAGD